MEQQTVQEYFFLVHYMSLFRHRGYTQTFSRDCTFENLDLATVYLSPEERNDLRVLTFGLEGAGVLVLLLTACFLVKASRKKKEIVYPAKNLLLDWNQTYCVLSLRLVQIVQAGLLINIPRVVYLMTLLALPDSTVQWWYLQKRDFPSCVHIGAGYVIHYLIWDLMFALGQIVFLVQGFEWIAMHYLITFQKTQTVEQIMSCRDTQILSRKSEPPTTKETDKDSWFEPQTHTVQEAFHLKEVRLLRYMRLFASLLIAIYIVALNSFYFIAPQARRLILEGLEGFTVVFQTVCLLALVRQMSRFHKLEYSLHKRTLVLQWVLAVAIETSHFLFFKFERLSFVHEISFFYLNLPLILVAVLFLYVKSSQDVLQGLSKLDYLVKVSIFQRFKHNAHVVLTYETTDSDKSLASSLRTIKTGGLSSALNEDASEV